MRVGLTLDGEEEFSHVRRGTEDSPERSWVKGLHWVPGTPSRARIGRTGEPGTPLLVA